MVLNQARTWKPTCCNKPSYLLLHEGDGGHESGGFYISHMSNAAYLLYSGGFSRNVSLHHWHLKYLFA